MTMSLLPESLKPIDEFLTSCMLWIDEIPPEKEVSMRFGNKSFRTWLDRVKERVEEELMSKLLPTDELARAKVELTPYLLDSFGSYERIDYGTGHELNFFVFLFCLF